MIKALWLLSFVWPVLASATPLALKDALNDAEKFSPRLSEAGFHEKAAAQEVRAARSGYLPSLDFAAIGSTGKPGAFPLLGVDSNISSANRIGEGGGLVLHQTLWDFGRTGSAVDAAKSEQGLRGKERDLRQVEVDLEVTASYFRCALLKSEIQDARFIADQARLIATEMEKFVKSGQRSIIERYLVDAEVKDAETKVAEYSERTKSVEGRLGVEMGQKGSPECPDLDQGEQQLLGLEGRGGPTALLAVQQAKLQVAGNLVDVARAKAMPLLQGLANWGYFENRLLKDKWNNAAGVALSLPLFAGFQIDAGIERSTAELEAAEAGVQATQQSVAEVDSRYDEEVQAARVRLDSLNSENKLAEEAFQLAKKRYFRFQGTMVDLRDALRNYSRVRYSINAAQYDWFLARASRALFHGARTAALVSFP